MSLEKPTRDSSTMEVVKEMRVIVLKKSSVPITNEKIKLAEAVLEQNPNCAERFPDQMANDLEDLGKRIRIPILLVEQTSYEDSCNIDGQQVEILGLLMKKGVAEHSTLKMAELRRSSSTDTLCPETYTDLEDELQPDREQSEKVELIALIDEINSLSEKIDTETIEESKHLDWHHFRQNLLKIREYCTNFVKNSFTNIEPSKDTDTENNIISGDASDKATEQGIDADATVIAWRNNEIIGDSVLRPNSVNQEQNCLGLEIASIEATASAIINENIEGAIASSEDSSMKVKLKSSNTQREKNVENIDSNGTIKRNIYNNIYCNKTEQMATWAKFEKLSKTYIEKTLQMVSQQTQDLHVCLMNMQERSWLSSISLLSLKLKQTLVSQEETRQNIRAVESMREAIDERLNQMAAEFRQNRENLQNDKHSSV